MSTVQTLSTLLIAAALALFTLSCADESPEASTSTSDAQTQHAPSVSQAPDNDYEALCGQIPTQIIPLSSDAAIDEPMVRVVIAPSRECEWVLTISSIGEQGADHSCLLTVGGRQVPGTPLPAVEVLGDCQGFEIDRSALINDGLPRDQGTGCSGIDSLELIVDASNFNERGRVDLVAFDPQSRCYIFLSATQSPHRAAPFQFGPDDQCVLRFGKPEQGQCDAIAFWSGRGRGGVQSQAEAEAQVQMISHSPSFVSDGRSR